MKRNKCYIHTHIYLTFNCFPLLHTHTQNFQIPPPPSHFLHVHTLSPPETEEEKGADGEGEDEDVPDVPTPTLQESLEQLGLKDFTEVFEKEQIDFDSLVSECSSTCDVCAAVSL